MKSIKSKLSIIILSLLASTHTFAFNSEQVCKAMNDAVAASQIVGASLSTPLVWGPITNIYSRKTSATSISGEVIGNLGGWKLRIESGPSPYLDCSGETCHVNKKWPDCECTAKTLKGTGQKVCAESEAIARKNVVSPDCRIFAKDGTNLPYTLLPEGRQNLSGSLCTPPK